MLTAFGKIVRKLRIDREETLGQMALNLGRSPTFLTAVETGRKPVPDDYLNEVMTYFGLSQSERDQLRHSAEVSRPSVKFNLPVGTPTEQRAFLALLEKHLGNLNKDEVAKMMQVLDQKETGTA